VAAWDNFSNFRGRLGQFTEIKELPLGTLHLTEINTTSIGSIFGTQKLTKLPLARVGSRKLINFCGLPSKPTEVKYSHGSERDSCYLS
jgi:hypothetical protein